MQLGKAWPDLPNRQQLPGRTDDSAWKQLFPPAKGDRCHLDNGFIEQTRIVELAGKVAATDDPDVPVACGSTISAWTPARRHERTEGRRPTLGNARRVRIQAGCV